MKLSINTDFTKLQVVQRVVRATEAGDLPPAQDHVVLAHDERHLRRRVIRTANGGKILVDLPEPMHLAQHDRLLLKDQRGIEVIASEEHLYEIRPRDALHLAELCWHIGNRHLAARIEMDRILILRDHVIKAMLEGLGATVREVSEPFEPVHGAYSGHGHSHGHAHGHDRGNADSYGRLPGDPHYGHNHA
jgi:urease accessory protein